jgi:hypothetical protein
MIDTNLESLENVLKQLSIYEKKGFDLSYLRSFIKNYKIFVEINDIKPDYTILPEDSKVLIIKGFLEDTNIFPRIIDIIEFSNKELGLGFKSQNASRETTIQRIVKRIENDPDVKVKLKETLQYISKQSKAKKTKTIKNLSNSDDLMKWAEMLKDI